MLPIVYTFRRCPYAMRARMALEIAKISVEYREIVFRDKPSHMVSVSPKATVPVMILPNGQVIDESWDIMQWARENTRHLDWFGNKENTLSIASELVEINDHQFKPHLDQYKYADRHPENSQEYYRAQGEQFLQELETRLNKQLFLLDNQPTIADMAIFPFIRQFSMVDINWFTQAPYPQLQHWLSFFLETISFKTIMKKREVWKPIMQPSSEKSTI